VRGCEILWEKEIAEEVHQRVEKITGKACPFNEGELCPLLPQRLEAIPTQEIIE
jgi:hypothetical protein